MKIYLAGKITANGWRNKLVSDKPWSNDYEGSGLAFWGEKELNGVGSWPVLSGALPGGHDYTGPYFVRCDHGCYHQDHSHAVANPGCSGNDNIPTYDDVVEQCQEAIIKSDVLFAWIDSPDCYGTIAEIGYAVGRQKIVAIASDQYYADLWFVYHLAAPELCITSIGSAKEAFDRFVARRFLSDPDYKSYIASPQWRDIREKALEYYGRNCVLCGSGDRLNIHHRHYKTLYREQLKDVIVLCNECHKRYHEKQNGKVQP